MNIKYQIALTALILAASCSIDDKVGDYSDSVSLKSNISMYGTESYEWSFGDCVGISVYDSSATTLVDNVKHSNTSPNGTTAVFKASDSDETINWSDIDKGGLYSVYAPYREGVEGSKIKLDMSDQTTSAALDLMVASGSVSKIEEGFDFSHRLAILNFNIVADGDFTQAQLNNLTYTLDGIVTSGVYNIYSNQISLSSERTAVTGLSISNDTSVGTISVIVLPQDLAIVSLAYDASAVDNVEDGVIEGAIEGRVIEAGMSYTFDVDITRDAATVTSTSITDWTTGGSIAVGAVGAEITLEVGDYILQNGQLLKAADWEQITDINPAVGVFYIVSATEGESRAISVKRSDAIKFSTKTTFSASIENSDGRIATDIFFKDGGQTLSDYPAFQFCHDLNKQMGTSFTTDEEISTTGYTGLNDIWYIPARYESVYSDDASAMTNVLFSTFLSTNAAVLISTTGIVLGEYAMTYPSISDESTVVGVVCMVDYETEEKIMKSIYRAGGDPFDENWYDATWTDNTKTDAEIEALRDVYNGLGGFNSIRLSCYVSSASSTYNSYTRHWVSTATSNTMNYYVQYTRVSTSGESYDRGPTSSARTATYRVRPILRH